MKMTRIIGKVINRIRRSIVAQMICVCTAIAAVLIIMQGCVIGVYVTRYQEREAVENSYQILSVAEEYFKDIYNKIKSFNAQMYEEKQVREQVGKFVAKGELNAAYDKVIFRNLLNDHLKKQFGNDFGALIAANYYSFSDDSELSFYWEEGAMGRKEYTAPVLESIRKAIENGVARQRIYEVAVLSESSEESTLTLYDFVRNPDNLAEIVGVLMFHFAIDQISDKLYAMGFSEDMEVLLLSQNGELCYDTSQDFERELEELKDTTMVPGVYKNQEGMQVVCYNNRFGFYVVSKIRKEELYGSVRRMNLIMAVCTVVFLILLVAILYGFERHFSVRMKSLAEGILKIEAGSLDVALQETNNHDELDLMSHNLNEMQKRLKYQIEQEKENQERTRRLELLQKDAEFYALQAQIKPHFLYNTLEMIRMHAVAEHAHDTAVMVRLLADIFRENVNRQSMTTIAEAINYCEEYAELFSYRFEGELEVKFQVDPSARRYGIPTYVLQTVLENSLVHGLNTKSKDPSAVVSVKLKDENIVICVEDNGCGMEEKELAKLQEKIGRYDEAVKSIGLANVNHRLQLIFGEKNELEICSSPGEGTKVTIKFPALLPSDCGENKHV